MIGSIFPACQPFSRHFRGRRSAIRRKTWKWVAGVLRRWPPSWCGYRRVFAAGASIGTWLPASLARLRWPWLLLSLAPVAATYYGRALRWAVFLKPLKPHPSIRNLLSATVIGFTAITLFGRPGELVRPYLIAVKERVPVSSQFAAWVLERIFDLLMALLIFASRWRGCRPRGSCGPGIAWVLAVGGRVVGSIRRWPLLVLLLSLRHFAEPVRRRLLTSLTFLPEKPSARAEHLITAFVQGVESMRSDGALLLVLLYSVLEWALIAACYWCLAQSSSRH